jgi:hypothetical protein
MKVTNFCIKYKCRFMFKNRIECSPCPSHPGDSNYCCCLRCAIDGDDGCSGSVSEILETGKQPSLEEIKMHLMLMRF